MMYSRKILEMGLFFILLAGIANAATAYECTSQNGNTQFSLSTVYYNDPATSNMLILYTSTNGFANVMINTASSPLISAFNSISTYPTQLVSTAYIPSNWFFEIIGVNDLFTEGCAPSGVQSVNGQTGIVTLTGSGGTSLTTSSTNVINIYSPTYSASTGLSLSTANAFSLLPLTAGTGISISSTNTINLLPLTASTGIAISTTNVIAMLGLTSGTGISITSTNTVNMLPLTANAPISMLGTTNTISLLYTGNLFLTNSQLNSLNPASTTYSAGTGLSLSGTIFSLLPLTASTGISVTSTNAIAMLGLTSGTGISITSTNTVNMLPLTGVNGILVSNTNTLAVNVLAPLTNTLGEVGLAYTGNLFVTGGSLNGQNNQYTASTGLSLSAGAFSLLPLTASTGISITSTNTVAMLSLTAGTGISISSTNTVNMLPLTNTLPIEVTNTNSLNFDFGGNLFTTNGQLNSLNSGNNYNSLYITTVTGVNGILSSTSGQTVTLAVNAMSPITNTLGYVGLAYTGNLFTTGGSLNSQFTTYNSAYWTGTNYNSLYITTISGVNGIISSASGQTVTLAVNAMGPITNTLNEIGCSGCTSYNALYWTGSNYNSLYWTGSNYNSLYWTGSNYNALYIQTVSGVNGVLVSTSGQTITLAVNVLSPISNTFGYITDHPTNYNALYLTTITGTNGVLATTTGQSVALAINALGPITNTLNEVGLAYGGNIIYNGVAINVAPINGVPGAAGATGVNGIPGANGIPGYTPSFSATIPLMLSPTNVFSLDYGGNVFLDGSSNLDSLNSGGAGTTYTAKYPLVISPANQISLVANGIFTFNSPLTLEGTANTLYLPISGAGGAYIFDGPLSVSSTNVVTLNFGGNTFVNGFGQLDALLCGSNPCAGISDLSVYALPILFTIISLILFLLAILRYPMGSFQNIILLVLAALAMYLATSFYTIQIGTNLNTKVSQLYWDFTIIYCLVCLVFALLGLIIRFYRSTSGGKK